MSKDNRATARELARRRLANGDPMGWFEVLYAMACSDPSIISWAALGPNPNLVSWFEQQGMAGTGKRARKVGCGLGDDAEELSRRGFEATAFDISPSAISWCRRRFQRSSVYYVVADLFRAPDEWWRTIQALVNAHSMMVQHWAE